MADSPEKRGALRGTEASGKGTAGGAGASTGEDAGASAAGRLDEIRRRIDGIDAELLRLLNERADCALQVAEIKRSQGQRGADPRREGAGDSLFYRPEREAQILARIRAENPGPLAAEDLVHFFREIMSLCLSLEQPLSVAYLGPEGTFSETAAIKQFGHFSHTRARASIDEIFREVEARAAHYGVVPVENSTEGPVNQTLDCFMLSPLKICGELELPIHQCLIAAEGTDPGEIEVVYSHQQSLAQCRRWLDAHYGGVEREAVASNAEAAKLAASRPRSAAVGGELAADRYELTILASRIEDFPDNRTRFLVIGSQHVAPSGRDKTSILVSARNEPGALFRLLEPFHRYGINLTRLESRPSKSGSWSYVFFIDFLGHQDDATVTRVLEEVANVSIEVKLLGSYPQAVI